MKISMFMCTLLVAGAGCALDEDRPSSLKFVPSGDITAYVESGAVFPGEPLVWVTDVSQPTMVAVTTTGSVTLANGGRQGEVMVDRDGAVDLPALVGGPPGSAGAVAVRAPDGTTNQAAVVGIQPGSVKELRAALQDDSGVVAEGPGFIVLDPARLHVGDEGRLATEAGSSSALEVCFCPFLGNIGRLAVDASCRGRLAMWVIPEFGGAAVTPAIAGTNYYADGYKIGSTIYKIDGSTCNTMYCGTTSMTTRSCVNSIALLLNKRAPYPVAAGTFGNEPPAGAAARYVQ